MITFNAIGGDGNDGCGGGSGEGPSSLIGNWHCCYRWKLVRIIQWMIFVVFLQNVQLVIKGRK